MSTAPRNIIHQSEDIDLLLLAERLISFFKKYKWLFIIAAITGLALGYLFYRSMPVVYKSRLVVHSYVLTNQEQLQIVNNWNQLLKKGEHTILADIFNTDEDLLSQVKQLKGAEIQQVFTPNNPNGFTIDATVTNNTVLDSLQAGIVYAFENSEYIRERLEAKRSTLRELILKTTIEIAKLDSTKKTVEGIIDGSRRSSSALLVDGSNINRQLIEMNEKLLSFKESLQFTNAVQVLQRFSKFKNPAGPHLLPWLLIGLLFFIALAWFISLVHSINSKLNKRRQERLVQPS